MRKESIDTKGLPQVSNQKMVYVVVPHYWDTIMGDVVVFSTLRSAEAFIKTADATIQHTIYIRFVDQPDRKVMVPQKPREWTGGTT